MTEKVSFEVYLDEPYDRAIDHVVEALKNEGFGVLTRIDVKATFKEKLDKEFRPYVILGACNPPLSHQALTSDPAAGILLPCNVTVEAGDEGGSVIRIANPETLMQVGEVGSNPEVREVAREARARLQRVAAALVA